MKICLSRQLLGRLEAPIRQVVPDAALITLGADGDFSADADGIDVFLFSVDLSLEAASLTAAWELLSAESLAWVQAPGAGVELPIWSELVDRSVRVTTAAGVHAEPVAQYVFTYVLHWHRQVTEHQACQRDRSWAAIRSDDLTTKTLGIVGLGGIGFACARIARGFGMRTVGLRRSAGEDDRLDRHYRPDQLHDLLVESDYVLLCLPLTDETRHLMSGPEFAAMGRDAVLINVARGPVVDAAALKVALQEGVIRGATLDVTDPEPLPETDELWTLENCIITPHDAGYSPLAGQRLGELFLENLQRYVEGQPLRNEVS